MAKKKGKRKFDIQSVTLITLLVVFLGVGLFVLVDSLQGESATPSEVVDFNYAEQPRIGKANAPVKLMEFGDFKCPTCKYFHDQIYPQLKKDYIDTGKVQMYFKNFQFLGKDSITAGMVGESIYKQNNDAFWKYYDAIYTHQQDEQKEWATPEFLLDLVKKNIPEVDIKKIEADLKAKTHEKTVNTENIEAQQKYKLTGVPAVYINGKAIEQSTDYNVIRNAIEEELKKQ